jgi:hypothetical protein
MEIPTLNLRLETNSSKTLTWESTNKIEFQAHKDQLTTL